MRANFIEARGTIGASTTGRIYGSKPVPASLEHFAIWEETIYGMTE
jgi:hypothetical protein